MSHLSMRYLLPLFVDVYSHWTLFEITVYKQEMSPINFILHVTFLLQSITHSYAGLNLTEVNGIKLCILVDGLKPLKRTRCFHIKHARDSFSQSLLLCASVCVFVYVCVCAPGVWCPSSKKHFTTNL